LPVWIDEFIDMSVLCWLDLRNLWYIKRRQEVESHHGNVKYISQKWSRHFD